MIPESPANTLLTAVVVCALLAIGLPARAQSAQGAAAPEASSGEVRTPWQEAADVEIRAFTDGEADPAELSKELQEAAAIFLGVAESPGGDVNGFWRAARAEWLSGEMLPLGDDDAKVERFERAASLAQRGIDANPECGECMMWKFSAMARLATTRGLMTAVRQAREMNRLLERGIELEPTHTDGPGSSTLGNLYYASANWNRVVPDSIWVKWLVGVRGDREKGLAHSRKALELHPDRLDYRVEVGTQLLCIGTEKKKPARLEEGIAMLESIADRPGHNEDERREIFFAKQLLEDPDKACGYTGDKLVDLEAEREQAEDGDGGHTKHGSAEDEGGDHVGS
jgi:hypothetical protein